MQVGQTSVTITIVQKTGNVEFTGVGSTTLTSTPTAGNLLLCVGVDNDSTRVATPVGKDGWTLIYWKKGSAAYVDFYYKYSDGSKILASPASGNVSTRQDMIFMEVAGVSSNWPAAYIGATGTSADSVGWLNLAGPSSTSSGQLGIAVYDNVKVFGATPTIVAPWSVQYAGGLFFNQSGIAIQFTTAAAQSLVSSCNWSDSATDGKLVLAQILIGDGAGAPPAGPTYFRSFPQRATLFPTDQSRTFPRT